MKKKKFKGLNLKKNIVSNLNASANSIKGGTDGITVGCSDGCTVYCDDTMTCHDWSCACNGGSGRSVFDKIGDDIIHICGG